VRRYLDNETFCLTYGDGVGNVDIEASIRYHRQQGVLATLTAVRQPGRFGVFNLGDDERRVSSFTEKPEGGVTPWVNGGFFVLEPAVLDYIDGDDTTWERAPLERLAAEGNLAAYRHPGFWQPMDTLRDRNLLEELWQSGQAEWHVWANDLATPVRRPAPTSPLAYAGPDFGVGLGHSGMRLLQPELLPGLQTPVD
jgi:glucose-1-phosphate cytidylyltransferase